MAHSIVITGLVRFVRYGNGRSPAMHSVLGAPDIRPFHPRSGEASRGRPGNSSLLPLRILVDQPADSVWGSKIRGRAGRKKLTLTQTWASHSGPQGSTATSHRVSRHRSLHRVRWAADRYMMSRSTAVGMSVWWMALNEMGHFPRHPQ